MKFTLIKKKREDNALYNPTRKKQSDELPALNEQEPEQSMFGEMQEEIPESQMKLGIKESKLEPIYKVRRSISSIERKAEVIPFWRSGVTVISMSLSIFSVLIIGFLIYYFFPRLPREMPLFYDHAASRWGLYDKTIYLLLPILYAAVVAILWRIIYSVFFFDRRLALVVTWSTILLSLLAMLGISQILSLVLL